MDTTSDLHTPIYFLNMGQYIPKGFDLMFIQKSRVSLIAVCFFLLMSSFPWMLPQIAYASDGTPFSTINLPGTFEAEDFNSGAINDVYFAHPSTQITRDTTYRDVQNVDIFKEVINSVTLPLRGQLERSGQSVRRQQGM